MTEEGRAAKRKNRVAFDLTSKKDVIFDLNYWISTGYQCRLLFDIGIEFRLVFDLEGRVFDYEA